MSTPRRAILATELSKVYWRDGRVRPDTLRDAIAKLGRSDPAAVSKEFVALNKVSFELMSGQSLAVIGSNGSGKSTLLKILSRVIEPTAGRLRIDGRTASLLEVGTGFHPELTGRENMLFNGSLLGLSRREIERRSDAILEFAGVEEFADTPVKHYSSGMHVRLAFAVASQLEPDILIVDEALAVGDYQFQQRSVERMRQATRSGQTVVLVTHAMGFVDVLCDTAMLLDHGNVAAYGPAADVVAQYITATSIDRPSASWERDATTAPETWNPIVVHRIRVFGENGKTPVLPVRRGAVLTVEMDFELLESTVDLSVGFTLLSEHNVRLLRSTPFDSGDRTRFPGIRAGRHLWQARVPTEWLSDGDYTITFDADQNQSNWYHNPFNTEARVSFTIQGSIDDQLVHWHKDREGAVKLPVDWRRATVQSGGAAEHETEQS